MWGLHLGLFVTNWNELIVSGVFVNYSFSVGWNIEIFDGETMSSLSNSHPGILDVMANMAIIFNIIYGGRRLHQKVILKLKLRVIK